MFDQKFSLNVALFSNKDLKYLKCFNFPLCINSTAMQSLKTENLLTLLYDETNTR